MASKKKSGARRGKRAASKSVSKVEGEGKRMGKRMGKARSATASTRASKPAPRRRGRASAAPAGKAARGPVDLAALSTEALAAELKRRRNELPKLEKRAASLRAELAAVERRIAELGGAAPAVAATAPREKGRRASGAARASGRAAKGGRVTLGSRIAAFLAGRDDVASPKEIADAMAAELGRERTSSFYVQTNLALRKLVESGEVAQTGRAQYRSTGKPAAQDGPGADGAGA